MWSTKQNANGARNQFYENMRAVSPGDVVFSFCDTPIKAIGVVTGGAQTGPKPRLRRGRFELVVRRLVRTGGLVPPQQPDSTQGSRGDSSAIPPVQVLATSSDRRWSSIRLPR